MEDFKLKSKVAIDEREFLVQTTNDDNQKAVISSLFVDGKILEVSQYPHPDVITTEEVQKLIKLTHEEKKTELEHLFATYNKVITSSDPDLMFNVGTAFYCKKLFDEAAVLFESVISVKPDYHPAGNYLGLTMMALRRYEEAAKVLGRAVELRPKFADYHNNYGEALLECGFCRRAVEEFEAALRLNIYYGEAYLNYGIAYVANAISREDFEMYSNLVEKTKEIFDKAVMISSEYKTSRYEEAIGFLENGDTVQALSLFKAVRDIARDKKRQEFSSYYLKFLLLSDISSEKAVTDRINQLIERIENNPNYSDLNHELGLCYLHQAQINWKKGIDRFSNALELNPKLRKSENGKELAIGFSEEMKKVLIEIARL